jgi:nitroreductase
MLNREAEKMEFMELARARQSLRRYSERTVESSKIDLCIEAARIAPSASNGQPWRFVLVDEPALKGAVAEACVGPGTVFNRFAAQAPVLVVVIVEPSTRLNRIGAALKGRDYPLIDVGIAAEHFCLQAAELGLGTCMIGWFGERRIKKLLGVPAGKRLGLMISVGYPEAGEPFRPKARKPIEAILGRNAY